MPPKDRPPLPAELRRTLLRWIETTLNEVALAQAGDPGPVVLRRLSNAEYTYTIRDLTGVKSLDPAREFPVDGAASEGFTNAGAALVMSPSLLTKYLDAAKEIAGHAVLLPSGVRFSPYATPRDWTDETLATIREFYAQFSSSGGATSVNLQGIKFDPQFRARTFDRYLQLVARSLDFAYSPGGVDAKEPFLCHAPEDCAVTKGFFQANRKNVIMVPETSIAYKNYPKEKLVEVANHLRENILVCHGSADELAAARYLAANSRYVTLLPHLDLNQLKAAIGQADLVIGGDTGPTHMAWAMNVPSLALFGATAPPYRGTDRHRLLVSASVANPRKPDKNDLSVADIPVTEVVRQAQELLNPTSTRST